MKTWWRNPWLICLLVTVLQIPTVQSEPDNLKVLIVDGRNNHDWQITTDAVKATLEATGKFDVHVSTLPKSKIHFPPRKPKDASEEELRRFQHIESSYQEAKARALPHEQKEWDEWNPMFSNFDTIILNYNGPSWPERVQDRLVQYVKGGGGLVLVHASNNGFRNWTAFNAMIGFGYNGHRGLPTDQPAPCVKVDDATGETYLCCEGKSSGHGSMHPFVVKVREPDHPIMRGIPAAWMHGKDELYHHLRGTGKNATILSSAWSDPATRGTGMHEPITWTVNYRKGRVVVTTMGHCWPRQTDFSSLYCVGFQTILARSAEFTATGKVTLPVPDSFPTAESTSVVAPHQVNWGRNNQTQGAKTEWKKRKEQNPFAMLTPEEERESFQLPDGYVAELVAAEPMVQEPVLAVWDGNGAMYVAEMRSYMQDEKGTGTKTLRNGRVKRLVDLDGDGRMDQATVFVDGLNLPRMILPLDDRIAVVETDDTTIWSYRDTDHDGIADEKKILFKGKKGASTRSVEHQDSGLMWNIDNWIYLSYNHTRYRFTNGTLRAEPAANHWAQWGLAHDDTGHIFYTDNNKPVLSFQIPRKYWNYKARRKGNNPRYTPTIGLPYDHSFLKAKNLSLYDDRGGQAPATKTFTSICGQEVFRGDAFPIDAYGQYFFCDPTIHVVRRSKVENQNGKRILSRVDGDEEFMISPDINFRPVNTHTGPDGCLYVVDMYRGIIQDAPWLSAGPRGFIKDSGLSKNNQHGRIWRIRHKDHTPRKVRTMQNEPTEQLIRHFESRNGWVRDTAQKLLILREDRETVTPLLNGLLKYDLYAPLVRLHALWTLEGMDAISPETLYQVFDDRDTRLRIAGLQIAEQWIKNGDAKILNQLGDLANDPSPEVVKQLILTLGWQDTGEARTLIENAANRHISNEGVFMATMASLWKQETPFIQSIRDGSAFDSIEDEEERLPIMKRWVEGIATWKREDLKLPNTFDSRQKWLIGHGETIYFETCRSCHGANGEGQLLPGSNSRLAPSLRNSPRVLGDPEKLIRILLHGLIGPVDGKNYDAGAMPTIASLGYDNENRIAQAANYIRYAWGHKLPPIEVDLVKKVQKETMERQLPWTLEELEK